MQNIYTNSNGDYATHRTSRMTQIKARFAGNGHPLARAATPSWVILDVPNPLKYKDRPKHALAWTALSKLVVDGYSGVWMPCHASARFGCVSHNHRSS
jgi:hypothetical protein